MRMFVGVTDESWYKQLARLGPDEVNFWQPGGKVAFKALSPGELFLFKLHSPNNYVVGGGFFLRHTFLPVSLAWQAFGTKNGTVDESAFYQRLYHYRKTNAKAEPDPTVGCIVLASPFFFPRTKWIPIPHDWSHNIVKGKTYDTAQPLGLGLYEQVTERLERNGQTAVTHSTVHDVTPEQRYGAEYGVAPRLGQGGFRVMVTEAYHRRCAITGEKTLRCSTLHTSAHIR